MNALRPYRRRGDTEVLAIRLELDFEGFSYVKWGARQICQRGDWLVDNGGDIYTVDGETFARTYQPLAPGRYIKTTPVWARRAEKPGRIATQEGTTDYELGDFLVYNDPEGRDGYAIAAATFRRLYEPLDTQAGEPPEAPPIQAE